MFFFVFPFFSTACLFSIFLIFFPEILLHGQWFLINVSGRKKTYWLIFSRSYGRSFLSDPLMHTRLRLRISRNLFHPFSFFFFPIHLFPSLRKPLVSECEAFFNVVWSDVWTCVSMSVCTRVDFSCAHSVSLIRFALNTIYITRRYKVSFFLSHL